MGPSKAKSGSKSGYAASFLEDFYSRTWNDASWSTTPTDSWLQIEEGDSAHNVWKLHLKSSHLTIIHMYFSSCKTILNLIEEFYMLKCMIILRAPYR